MTEFQMFPKIARYSREVIVTEKIDGTNASIFIGEDGEFLTGSRKRWITPDQDNYGFSRWAHDHKDELLTLGPGRHFGEWWGSGIQRGYGYKNGERFFSMFNTVRWCLHTQEPQQIPTGDPRQTKMQDVLPSCCGLVPVLWRGNMDQLNVKDIMDNLRGKSLAADYSAPEGIVVFHTHANTAFKLTFDDNHKFNQ